MTENSPMMGFLKNGWKEALTNEKNTTHSPSYPSNWWLFFIRFLSKSAASNGKLNRPYDA